MTKQINHWLLFLDMERRELLEMACEKNEKVRRAVENYEVLTGDEEVKRLAEIRLMAKLEEKSALDCAREEGEERGKEIGRKEGEERGKEIGREVGRKQGEEQKQKEIAQKMKKQKMPIKQIAEITGLSEEEIEKI